MFKLTESDNTIRTLSEPVSIEGHETIPANATVPKGHRLWATYEAWLALGNTPEPFDNRTEAQKLDQWRQSLNITKRQAKEALIRQGKYQQAVDALGFIADPTEKAIANNYWSESQSFERKNAVLNDMAVNGLGMTPAELDDLFMYAATL